MLLLIGLVDIFGGLLLVFNPVFLHNLLFYFGVIILLKGLWSIVSSAVAHFYFDLFGWIDMVASVLLLIAYFDSPLSFAGFAGIVILLKGLWSILFVF